MARAFLTADWQQMREQFSFSSLRDPTHWIITTLARSAAPLSASRSLNSTWVTTRSLSGYRYSLGSYSRAPVATMITPWLTLTASASSPTVSFVVKFPL